MYSARLIRDSVNEAGFRLSSFIFTMPKFIQAELNTHRLLSRGSASSRAIPTSVMLTNIQEDPVLPVFWGKNQKGMQAEEMLDPASAAEAREIWLELMRANVRGAQELAALGVHKQLANRPTETWMFTSVLVTATEFQNFFGLRDHPDAQPEFKRVASEAHELYSQSTPQLVKAGGWHLPLCPDEEELTEEVGLGLVGWAVAGRCARLSYLTHEKKRDPNEDLRLARDCLEAGHMGPFEHPCLSLTWGEWKEYVHSRIDGWLGSSNLPPGTMQEDGVPLGNIRGWLPLRKSLPLEHNFKKILLARGE